MPFFNGVLIYKYFIPHIWKVRYMISIYDFLECWIAIWVAKADFCWNNAWQIGHIIFKVFVVLWDDWCLFKVAFELNTFPHIEQSWNWNHSFSINPVKSLYFLVIIISNCNFCSILDNLPIFLTLFLAQSSY